MCHFTNLDSLEEVAGNKGSFSGFSVNEGVNGGEGMNGCISIFETCASE